MGALSSCSEKGSGFVVNGKINNQNGNLIYIEYKSKIDSIRISNDSFSFEGSVDVPTEAFIWVNKNSTTPWIVGSTFMLENSEITLELNYRKRSKKGEIRENMMVERILGSNTQIRVDNYHNDLDINFYQEENDSLKGIALYGILKNFLTENPKLEFSGKQLSLYAGTYKQFLDVEKVEFLFTKLDTIHQKKEILENLRLLLKQRKLLDIGNSAPSFRLKNLDEEIFDIEDDNSKFTLIDFWASWCMPCRSQNPEFVKLYKQYKDKGLEIVSISIDEDLNAWKKAIEKDSMTWVNLNDSNQIVANKYYMYQIPLTILADRNGKIFGKDLDVFTYNNDEPSFATILDSLINE
jgi:thiol-disulfide isomerase/thioredoxin